jgi:hypothetical protein
MRLPSYSSSDRRHMLSQLMDDDDNDGREVDDFLLNKDSSPATPVSPFLPGKTVSPLHNYFYIVSCTLLLLCTEVTADAA